MNGPRGFTLIETLIASLILVSGLVAVASMFSFSIRTNLVNHQRSVAITLLIDKMENLKALSVRDPQWSPGRHSEILRENNGTYLITWDISGEGVRNVTVIVSVLRSGLTNQRMELARATSSITNLF